MKKRYADGTEIEGTPEELAEFDRQRAPLPYWRNVDVTIPVAAPKVTIRRYETCAIQRYFETHPGATVVGMVCNCSRCTVRC